MFVGWWHCGDHVNIVSWTEIKMIWLCVIFRFFAFGITWLKLIQTKLNVFKGHGHDFCKFNIIYIYHLQCFIITFFLFKSFHCNPLKWHRSSYRQAESILKNNSQSSLPKANDLRLFLNDCTKFSQDQTVIKEFLNQFFSYKLSVKTSLSYHVP